MVIIHQDQIIKSHDILPNDIQVGIYNEEPNYPRRH